MPGNLERRNVPRRRQNMPCIVEVQVQGTGVVDIIVWTAEPGGQQVCCAVPLQPGAQAMGRREFSMCPVYAGQLLGQTELYKMFLPLWRIILGKYLWLEPKES